MKAWYLMCKCYKFVCKLTSVKIFVQANFHAKYGCKQHPKVKFLCEQAAVKICKRKFVCKLTSA